MFFLGLSILQVSATDADDPTSENGQLEYNLVSGNVGGRFTIDKTTGELYVSVGAVFDYEIRNVYNLTVSY